MRDFENIVISFDRRKAWTEGKLDVKTQAAKEGHEMLRPFGQKDIGRETDQLAAWTSGYNRTVDKGDLAKSGGIQLSSYYRQREMNNN